MTFSRCVVLRNDNWSDATTPDAVTTRTGAFPFAGNKVTANNDWENCADALALTRATQQAGAFPLASQSRDAALIVTLAPGSYTALLDGANGTQGIGLVEVFALPPD